VNLHIVTIDLFKLWSQQSFWSVIIFMNLHLDNFYHREIVLTTSLRILDLSLIDLQPELRLEQDLTPEDLFELKS